MCSVLMHIRTKRRDAITRGETAAVETYTQHETEHLEKCLTCALESHPLYLDLWNNSTIGVDVYDTQQTDARHHRGD